MEKQLTKEEVLTILARQFSSDPTTSDKSAIGFYNWLIIGTDNDKENIEKLLKLIKK